MRAVPVSFVTLFVSAPPAVPRRVDAPGRPRATYPFARTMGVAAFAMLAAACSESPTSPSAAAPASGSTASAPSTSSTASTATTNKTNTADTTTQMGYSLRFGGSTGSEVDRVKVPVDPNVTADVGRDFTLEFWIKAEPGANATSTCQAGNDGWTYGNVILDRDVSGDGDFGEYGVSISGGRVAFGIGRSGRAQTLCGLIDVADGRWHHVALTRRATDGQMRIYVDGTESAQGIGPVGDISYRDGRPTASSQDPFLVVGATKRDEGDGTLGFTGLIDELRVSARVRYTTPFDRPLAAFTTDADTTLLFHFDEGPGGPCLSSVMDTSGRATHGQCRYGGNGTPGPAYAADVPFTPPSRQSRSWLLGNQPGAPGSTTQPPTGDVPAATPPPDPQ